MHFCLLDALFSLYIWCFFSSCFGFSRRKLRGSDRREHEYWKQFYSIFNNAFSVVFLSSLFLSLFVFVSISSWNRFLYFCLFFHSSSHSHYTSVYFFFLQMQLTACLCETVSVEFYFRSEFIFRCFQFLLFGAAEYFWLASCASMWKHGFLSLGSVFYASGVNLLLEINCWKWFALRENWHECWNWLFSAENAQPKRPMEFNCCVFISPYC